MMLQRVVYGALAIAVIVAVVLMDVHVADRFVEVEGALADLFRRGSFVPLIWTLMLLLAAVELDRIYRAKQAKPFRRFACTMTCLLALAPWFSAAGWLGHGPAQIEGLFWPATLIVISVIGIGLLTVTRRNCEGGSSDAAATLTIIIYLGFLGSFVTQLRCGRDIPGVSGAGLLLITLLVTKASDIGAFLTGSAVGRHKLAPSISPGKTIEGAIGGLLTSTAVAVLIVWACSAAIGCAAAPDAGTTAPGFRTGLCRLTADLARGFVIQVNPGGMSPISRAAIFGFTMSAIGQLGDLFESSFKRDAQMKDSGSVIPRFGGILDLIDSPVVAVPVAWFLLTTVWNVV